VFLKLDNEQFVLPTFDDTISHLVHLKAKQPRRDHYLSECIVPAFIVIP
jgi:hypothetical protein